MKQLLDDTPLTFGKYEGESPEEIAGNDPSYVVWLYDNLDKKPCTRKIRDICADACAESEEAQQDMDNFYEYDGW